MRNIFIIQRLTFREAVRKKVLWAAILLGLLFLVVYSLGFHFIRLDVERNVARQGGMSLVAIHEIYNFLMLSGLYAVHFLTIGMSVLISVDTLSGEITSGTIQTLVTKPIKRVEVVLGKWLGLVSMLTLYLLMMVGGTIGVVTLTTGYIPPNMLQGFLLMWLNTLLLLSLSMFGGSFLSTLTNGVTAFGLFGVAFVGGWVEHIGTFLQNQVTLNVGIVASLIFPADALWRLAAHRMQSPIISAAGFSPFTMASPPSFIMVVYAVLYTTALLVLTIRIFSRRDL